MGTNIYYLELMPILLNIFQPQKLVNKTTKAEILFFLKKKRQETLEKKLGCIFIKIKTSEAKRLYDTDYEASKIQIFISKFKDQKNKRKRKQNKRTRGQNKKIKTSINKSK